MIELNDQGQKFVSGGWSGFERYENPYFRIADWMDQDNPCVVDAAADAMCAATGKSEP